MGLRRVDSTTVVDDTGAQFYLPDTGMLGMMDIPQVNDAAELDARVAGMPPAPQPAPSGLTYPAPDMADPGNSLMTPGGPMPGAAQMGPLPVPQPAMSSDGSGLQFQQDPYARLPVAPAPQAPLPTIQGLPAQPTSASQAGQQESQSLQDYATATSGYAQATTDAATAAAQREADAVNQYNDTADKARSEHQGIYDAYARKADQEAADWVQEQQALANAKSDPHHYFHSRVGFQKVAWIVSLISGALAAGADQSKNVALKMLQTEMDNDLQQQNVEHQRKESALRLKGQAMDSRHARGLGGIKDRESAMIQRLTGVEKYLMAKAKVPGPEAQRAAYFQTAQLIADKKMGLVEKRVEQFHANARAAAQRSVDYSRIKEDRRQADQRLDYDKKKLLIDTQKDYDLAQMTLDGKLAAKGNGDMRTLPASTGYRLVGPNGETQEITVNKEQYESVARVASTYSNQATAVGKLRTALAKSDTSGWMLRNDAELVSAIEEAVGPVAKALNGGSGAMSDKDSARGYKDVLGVDPQSFIAQLKGPNREEMLKLLDKRIAELPGKAAQEIAIQSGVSMPKGFKIAYTPNDLAAKDAPTPGADDAAAAIGIKVQGPPHPATTEAYREAAKTDREYGAGTAVPPLPADLDKIVSNVSTVMTTQPKRVNEAAEAAERALNDYANAHPTQSTEVEAARVRLQVAKEDGTKAVQVLDDAVAEAEARAITYDERPKEVIDQALKEAGVTLSPRELKALVDEAQTRIDARLPAKKQPTLKGMKKK